jgi:nucleoid-associated protein YgaU
VSRRLFIGLFALIVTIATTIWILVLVREEPPPAPPARAERPVSPDDTDDASADEKRRAAAATAAATAAPPPVVAPPPAAVVVPQPPAVSEAPPPVVAPPPAAVVVPQPPAVSEATAPKAEPAPPPSPALASGPDKPAEESRSQEPPPSPRVEIPPPREEAPVPAVPAVAAESAAPAVAQVPAENPPSPPPPPPVSVAPAEIPPPAPPATVAPPAPPAPAVVAAPPPPPSPPPPAPRRIAPSFDVVRVAADGTAVIAGRAEPGAVVQVFDGEKEIGRITADPRGEWVLLPAGPMAPGTRELSLVAKGPGDIPELRSERVVVVVVPERQLAAQSGGALAVAIPREAVAAEPSRALQVPNPGPRPVAPISLAVETVDYDGAGNVVLSGRCPPGGTVLVYLDGKPIGRAVADGAGRWSLTPDGAVAPGVYTLRVDQLGTDGRVTQRMEMPFARAEPTAELGAASGDRIVVQPGNSLWRIARRVYGEGTRYSVIYQANREMIRDPNLIYPGQVFALPTGQAPAR